MDTSEQHKNYIGGKSYVGSKSVGFVFAEGRS